MNQVSGKKNVEIDLQHWLIKKRLTQKVDIVSAFLSEATIFFSAENLTLTSKIQSENNIFPDPTLCLNENTILSL